MEFTELNVVEFGNFMKLHKSHYTQSSALYEYKMKYKEPVYLVGVKDKGEVVAACLINSAPAFKFFNYFYTHRGPVMDHHNKELIDVFYSGLTKFMKKRRGLFVLADPHIIVNYRNHEGEVIEALSYEDIISEISRLGYEHQGFTVGYSMDSQARWLSVLDLKDKTEQQLLKDMEYKTRRNINKTIEMGVKIRDLSIDETDKFFELFKMAEDKHGFTFRDYDYFVRMQKTYAGQCRLVLSYIDLNNYLVRLHEELETKQDAFNQSAAELQLNPDFRKLRNKTVELEKAVVKMEKKIQETEQLKASDGDILELAAALYIYNDHELYYLSSGSNPKYNQFMGAYAMMWEMIKYAKSIGVDKYNFYGVSGDFSESSVDLGVVKFKKGFNAVIEEYIGDFIKPLHPMYRLYRWKSKR